MADLVENDEWSLLTSSGIGAYVAEARIEKDGVRLHLSSVRGEVEYRVSLSEARYPKLDERFRSAHLVEVLRSIGVEPPDHHGAFTVASHHLEEVKKHLLYRAKGKLPRVYKTMIACFVFGLGWIWAKHFLLLIAH